MGLNGAEGSTVTTGTTGAASSQPGGLPGATQFTNGRTSLWLCTEKPESNVIAQAATKKRRYDELSSFALFFTSIELSTSCPAELQ